MKSDERNTRLHLLFMAAVLVAVLLRWLYVTTLPDAVIWSDEREYLRLSQSLVRGEGFVTPQQRPTADRAIGYPFWLALIARVRLDSPTAVRLAQVVLSVACLLLMYGIARQLGDDRRALVALWFGALYPYFIYMAGAVLPTTLFRFLLLAAVWLLIAAARQQRTATLFAGGALFGLAILTVPSGLVLVCIAGFWLYVSEKVAWHRMAWLFAGCLVVVSPWLMRNYYQLGVWQVATSGGYNFWLGNNPAAQIELPGSIVMPGDMQKRLQALQDEKEISRLYQTEAMAFIEQKPAAALWRTFKKAILFWRLDPSPATQSYVRQDSVVRWLGIVCFSLLLFMAVLGSVTMPPAAKGARTLWLLFGLAFTLVHAVTIVKVRFRLPLDHFILVLAAFGLVWLGEYAFSWRRWPRAKLAWQANSLDFASDADWSQWSIERKGIVER